jgi:hypothetical protein
MNGMAEDSENTRGPNPDDEYAVLPPEPVRVRPTAPLYSTNPDEVLEPEPPQEEEGFQFSLAELMGVITAAAISLSIVCSLPGGGSLQIGVGVTGIGLFVGLIVLDYLRPARRIIYVLWWTLFVSYLVVGLLAAAGTF